MLIDDKATQGHMDTECVQSTQAENIRHPPFAVRQLDTSSQEQRLVEAIKNN